MRYLIRGESYEGTEPIGEISGNLWKEDIDFWVREMVRYGRTYVIRSRDGRQEEIDVIAALAEITIMGGP